MDVEFRGVSYSIGAREILSDLSFTVRAGETLVLLGASGSGKTTALKMVNAILYPMRGEVIVGGEPTAKWNPIALRRKIGYVIQEGGLFPHMTVAANVGIVPRLENWDPGRVRTRVDSVLNDVQLPPADYAARHPRELSGGQRQRVGVARALAAGQALLLFDEPFGALDPITRLEQQRQFLSLREQYRTTSLFVTHDVGEALRLGSNVALLHDGKLQALAPPAEFRRLDNPYVQEFLACLES
jgi:osmoprotectant transport system ATP-binding protein